MRTWNEFLIHQIMLFEIQQARGTDGFCGHICDLNGRIQTIISKIALIIFSIGFATNLSASSYEESVAKIRQNQASVKEYFLVCQVCADEFGVGDEKGFHFRESIYLGVNETKNQVCIFTETLISARHSKSRSLSMTLQSAKQQQ